MHKINAKTLVLISFLFLIPTTGCLLTDIFSNYVVDRGQEVEKQVEMTLTALAEEMPATATETPTESPTLTPQPSATPTEDIEPDNGVIRGNLGYPSEYIPPMRVVAFDVFSQNYYYVDTQRNQDSYEMTDIPPSTYHVVAYVREQGPDLAGGYSYFVTCGMTQACNNHDLIDVNVYAGEVTEGVDPVDFYIQPGEADWPENPTD